MQFETLDYRVEDGILTLTLKVPGFAQPLLFRNDTRFSDMLD